ncbi:hypothetical protein CES85_1622 [Ochrobactrum quorumnocens]|uniref:Uncharacterized protein n=1 Tax=Ochrobactrum quorumnocens TaxID=271865 RepID=A0A248UHW0_9HYPH|nr:hypothetical protein CES85_1622 [[Ochrobactrum] quorumnocens]
MLNATSALVHAAAKDFFRIAIGNPLGETAYTFIIMSASFYGLV